MSDPTLIEGASPESPREPKTLIEGNGIETPADGRAVLEQNATPSGQISVGINYVNLAPEVEIAGCILREQLRVFSGEADLWLAKQPGRQELIVLKVFRRWDVPRKTEITEKLRNIPKAQIVEVYGSGVLPDGRHYELLEYIQEGTLANLMQPGGVTSSLARQILLELTEALSEIHAAGILHRDLKPANILIRRRAPLDLVLTDFGISSLSDQTSLYVTGVQRTAAYSAPEAMTGVIGKSSDWWSVGVILLELLTGRHPFAGMNELIVNFQLVSRGIEVPVSLAEEWQLLLKGLLTRDHQKRWGGEQVRAWLAGQRDILVFYLTSSQQTAQYRPYKFLGRDCATPAELAREAGQAKNWDDGVKSLQRRYIQDWVKQDVRDFDLLSKLQDIEDDKNLDWEHKLCAALLMLDPELPLCWRGEIITHDWFSEQATQGTQQISKALSLLTSSLPEWLQRCRNQTWMLEIRQRRQRLQNKVDRLGLSLARGDVDKAIFLPVEAVSAEAQRRKEVTHSAATEVDESLKSLLAKPKWNEAECVAAVACQFSRFLTKEQRWLEVKRTAETEIENLVCRAKADSKVSELQTVDSALLKLGQSLDQEFTSLSQPHTFERGDEQLQKNISECSQLCQQRIRLKQRIRKIIFVAGLSLTMLCGLIALHIWLLGETSLFFTFTLDGNGFPVGKSPRVTVDGESFVSGDKIGLGQHQLAVEFIGGEPFTKKIWSFYGENNLGVLPLVSSKGSLSVTVKPLPASVSVQRDWQLIKQADPPFKLDRLPVGDYSLIIHRGEYQEIHPIQIERERETEANIDLNLGSVDLSSDPADAEFELSGNNRHWQGKLPMHIDDVPVGAYQFIARRKGWELDEQLSVNRGNVTADKIEFQYGSIEVTSDPAGMIVSVDGMEIGKTPTTLQEQKPGQYMLTVTDGENDLNATIALGPKEAAKRAFTFHYGTLQLTSIPPGASVTRKGKGAGKTPLVLERIPAETTTVELRLAGYVSTNCEVFAKEGLLTVCTVKLFSERYVSAVKNAQQALDENQFDQARDSIAEAFKLEPTDPKAKALLTEINQKADNWRKQQLEMEQRAAEATARQLGAELEAFPLLNPEDIIADCWNKDLKTRESFSKLSTVDAAKSNPIAVPVAAAADVVVKGIEVIAWPFHKIGARQPRFDQGRFLNNYWNHIYRYYGNIAAVDTAKGIITFATKASHTVSAHFDEMPPTTAFPVRPGSPVWVRGHLITLKEGNSSNLLVLDVVTVYPPKALPPPDK